MIKGTPELIAGRREEIINACEKLYQSMGFQEITLKDIGNEVSFSRPTIYNYFQTKEEIFLALYEREYDRWNADLTVSRICMGCMGFGDSERGQHSWTVDEEHTRQIIRRGLDLGVNFYDTAIAYQSGTSEQFVGRALRDFAKREDVVVATKFLPRTQEEIARGITGQQHIETMINTSLKNLGMDYVDRLSSALHVLLS